MYFIIWLSIDPNSHLNHLWSLLICNYQSLNVPDGRFNAMQCGTTTYIQYHHNRNGPKLNINWIGTGTDHTIGLSYTPPQSLIQYIFIYIVIKIYTRATCRELVMNPVPWANRESIVLPPPPLAPLSTPTSPLSVYINIYVQIVELLLQHSTTTTFL